MLRYTYLFFLIAQKVYVPFKSFFYDLDNAKDNTYGRSYFMGHISKKLILNLLSSNNMR